jgi:hypothetical protein
MPERASLEELKEFANTVREAGGGNPLDALMPAVPQDVSRCLIARNLNFNCTVGAVLVERRNQWVMAVTDPEIRDRIAEKLNLEVIDAYDIAGHYNSDLHIDDANQEIPVYGVLLPERIGQVAEDFDNAWTYADVTQGRVVAESKDDAELLAMVEESAREARGIASIVNPDGSIVI